MTATGTPERTAHADRAQLDAQQDTPHIAVCIATYKRPHLLSELLHSFASVATPAGHSIEIRIVDNDARGSARSTVEHHQRCSRLPIHYACQPERNIARARNAALDMGPADLLAFIDDDETASPSWLVELVAAMHEQTDLAIGNVEPKFEARPPGWVQRGRFHFKGSGDPGDAVPWKSARTSNCALRGHWIYERGLRFDERFGKSGGEDTELFKRIHGLGGVFAAAPRSLVIETVHQEQCRLSWLMQRFWRNGINYERLVARDEQRHPLVRCTARMTWGLLQLALGIPFLVLGRIDFVVHPLLGLARAAGGMVGWLRPDSIEHGPGYRSIGCER